MKNDILIEPIPSEDYLNTHYIVKAYCDNCGKAGGWINYVYVYIRHGIRVPTKSLECPNCRCATLNCK